MLAIGHWRQPILRVQFALAQTVYWCMVFALRDRIVQKIVVTQFSVPLVSTKIKLDKLIARYAFQLSQLIKTWIFIIFRFVQQDFIVWITQLLQLFVRWEAIVLRTLCCLRNICAQLEPTVIHPAFTIFQNVVIAQPVIHVKHLAL